MTSLLKKAFDKAKKLPEIEQNLLARRILEELKAESKWEKLFSESEDLLAEMAETAVKDEENGKTSDLDEKKL
ncbi:MAG: hypothetical protein ACQETH_13035 [Candidatus Rifleibacteriota bacterium]